MLFSLLCTLPFCKFEDRLQTKIVSGSDTECFISQELFPKGQEGKREITEKKKKENKKKRKKKKKTQIKPPTF